MDLHERSCHSPRVEVLHNWSPRQQGHQKTWVSRLSTRDIEGDRFWYKFPENSACRLEGIGLVCDHLGNLIDDVVCEIPPKHELSTIDLDQAEI